MWVEKTKNGKYRYVERYKDPLTGLDKRASVTLEKNTRAARKQAAAILQEKIGNAVSASPGVSVTLSGLADAYLAAKKEGWKPSTYHHRKLTVNAVVALLGENVRADALCARYVRERLLNRGQYRAFKEMFRWGYVNDYVASAEWLAKLAPPKSSEEKRKMYLEKKELASLIDGIANQTYKDLTELLALTGLRIGEALALTYKDIDLGKRLIDVCKTYDLHARQATPPKTSASNRLVSIQDECLPLMERLRKEALLRKVSTGCSLLFQRNGKPLNYTTYYNALRKASERLIGRKVTPHMLRHTHTSLLADSGVDIETISRRLGHDNSSVTRAVYLHATGETLERDAEKVRHVRIL